MPKVFLGVGHGGIDSGAYYNGVKESNLNLVIALACRDFLEKHGVTVGMSRTKDEQDPLVDEIAECNAYAPNLAVDIHNNAGGGDGFEVYYHSKKPNTKKLAQAIESEVIAIGQNSRGCKIKLNNTGGEHYGFIRQINCDSVIVECAFIDNLRDFAIIDTPAEQKEMGKAIGRGILTYLGIEETVLPNGKTISLKELTALLKSNNISNIFIN